MNRVSVSCAPQDPAPPGVSSNRYHVATVLTRYRQYPCASYQLLHINASYDTFTVHVEPDRDPRPLQFAARRGRPVALTR
jgi:hypothetical protein